MNTKDSKGYYKILGLNSDASMTEIKKSYRCLANELHPDKNLGRNSTAEFQFLHEAYSILINPELRAQSVV